MKQPATAILFFAQSPATEAGYKHWGRKHRVRQRIARVLNQATLEKVRHTNWPVFHWDETQQQGRTFGEKLAHAIGSVFNHGYEQVIVVGNDCPQLRTHDLSVAAQHLATGHNVIGPDKDGGAYLIGLHRTAFDYNQWASLPWQSAELFEALEAHLNNTQLLPAKQDVNTSEALEASVRACAFPWRVQRKLLALLLQHTIRIFPLPSCFIAEPYYPAYSLRGPPGQ